MTQHGGQQRAREAVAQRMEQLRLSQRRLSADVGISTNTIARFLNGESWPRSHQIKAMEQGLRWPVGAMDLIANGGDIPRLDEFVPDRASDRDHAPTVGSLPREAAEIVVQMEPGYDSGWTAIERAEFIAYVQADAYRRAREIRASLRAEREEEPAP